MKIVVALDNIEIKRQICNVYEDNVFSQDIVYMEGLIEFLSSREEEYIVITKDTLQGNLTNRMYIKQLRLASPNSKIILIVAELSSEYKEFLFANEVLNILEGSVVSLEVLIENIEEGKHVVYKTIDNNVGASKTILNESLSKYETHRVIPKQLIAIYGTSGSGKSFVAGLLAKNISKDLDISVSLLDMDIQNPSIDIFNNVEGGTNALSQVVEDVDKEKEISSIISKYMINDKNNKNLWYMTSNTSLFDCQNKLSNKYYEKIFSCVAQKYDYTIIDLPSSPFLDVVPYTLTEATTIFFIVNPNYVSIRQAAKYLELITKLWNIEKSRISIVLNKSQRDSLDIYQIESILKDFKVVAHIDFNKCMEGFINGSYGYVKNNINMTNIYEGFGIKNIKKPCFKSNFNIKNIFKDKVMGVEVGDN